ncbi:helix-turn-helix transcriptional regulator [Streptomyces sp. NPDC001714]|uniref:helix-turn-helix transcriptional regulator n=1 Tax=Streptomyces sp. NPDC001714 TaxID=3364603 RepID=UPI0036CCA90B
MGEYIADLRAPLEISQEQLADKTGISRRTIQRIESGEGDPRYSELIRIAAALREDVDVLISGPPEGPARPPQE